MVEPHRVSLDGKGRAHAWHGTRGKTQSMQSVTSCFSLSQIQIKVSRNNLKL